MRSSVLHVMARFGTARAGMRRHNAIRHAGPVWLAAATALLLIWSAAGAHELVSERADQIVLRVQLKNYSLVDFDAGGISYKMITGSEFVPIAEAGEPDIPAYSFLIALPAGGSARVVSVQGSFETVARDVRVVPMARIETERSDDFSFARNVYEEDPAVYGSPGRFPVETAWVESRGRLRHQDVAGILVTPFSYEPVTGTLRAARELRVTLRLESGPGGRGAREGGGLRGAPGVNGRGQAGPARDDAWESLYENVLVNYEQGRRWRVARAPLIVGEPPANRRFKILISETGVYRVTYEALAGAGFPEDLPVDQIFIYRDEFVEGVPDTILMREVNLLMLDEGEAGVFSEGDEIIFYARDFYDEFGALWSQDRFFDRNVYWVSWGEGDHARMPARGSLPDLESPARPTHYTYAAHFEEDIGFCEYPPHEVADYYYWSNSVAGFGFDAPFEIHGLDPGLPGEVRANFIGFTYDDRSATDEVSISLISCLEEETLSGVGKYTIPNMRNFTFDFSPGTLCDGSNTFRFESSFTASYSPGTCLDWFEIIYGRRYEAYEDMLIFTSGDSLGEIEIDIGSFSGEDISLFDISDPYLVTQLEIGEENLSFDGDTYTLTFRDSIADTTSYIALAASAVHELSSEDIEDRGTPDLRTESGNYLIVCHPDFVDAIQPLIEQKEAQGHRVVLGTTEEVYDDFDNGMKSDTAILRFVKHGFHTWDAEYVLLVGDANVDRRGLLLDHPTNASDVDYVPSHSFRVKADKFPRYNWELRAEEWWFVRVDGPDDDYPDLYIGRLPVDTYEEAEGAVDKILAYENPADGGAYKKRIICAADDLYGDDRIYSTGKLWFTNQWQFMAACDSFAVIAADFSVVAPETVKYYLRRCTKDDQPDLRCDYSGCATDTYITQAFTQANCTHQLTGLLKDGAFVVNFQGHANESQLCHEFLMREDRSAHDVLDLRNAAKPFVFFGFGCWISNFDRRQEAMYFIQEAIGEKFIKNPLGAACASFASSCAELISVNYSFNSYFPWAIFRHLTPYDPHGNPVEARVILGEVVLTATLRYNKPTWVRNHILFGDPAMIMDMGAPLIATSVDGFPIDGSYVFEGDEPETLAVVSEIKDEEAITSIDIALVYGEDEIAVPAEAYSESALVDTGFVKRGKRGRAYQVHYDHVTGLGQYAVRITGTDYAGHPSSSEFEVNTGSVAFYVGSALLGEGGTVEIDQLIRVVFSRPDTIAADEIAVVVDDIEADTFEDYNAEPTDGGGKQWEVSFTPTLPGGNHKIIVDVQGFKAERRFIYVPGFVRFFADGRPLLADDFVSSEPELVVLVKGTSDSEMVHIEIDDEEPDSLVYEPDPEKVQLTAYIYPVLNAGTHTLAVTVQDVTVTTEFRVSDRVALTEASAFPNPFGDFVEFYYTLTNEAAQVTLEVFTVTGRKIYGDHMLPAYAGYNSYRWDGRDSAGDDLANGTYIYKLTIDSASGQREFTAPIVRLR